MSQDSQNYEQVTNALKLGNWFVVIESLMKCRVIPDSAHRILLYGPPGTGKTTCPFMLCGPLLGHNSPVESITLHQQFPPDDLIGMMGLVEQNGATVHCWQDGPAIRAMRHGGCLVINEISKRSPEVESALYNLLDDLEICRVTLPTGESVLPAPGFVVFATMNDDPSVLPEAIQERFDVVLSCNKPAPGILEKLPHKLSGVVSRKYEEIAKNNTDWAPVIGVRSVTAAVKISGTIGTEAAFTLKFGKSGVDILACAATNK